MDTFKQLVRDHKIAILLALLVSVIVALPQVYFRFDNRDILQEGVQSIELLPDSPWSARAREVQDGHPGFGNIYNKDGKDNPYLFQPLGSMVVGYMGQVFSLDINNTLLLSRIVLPFAVFLLVYTFVFLFVRDKLVALSSAFVLVLADSLLSFYGISQVLNGLSPDNFVRISRPVNPAMIYILFFGFLVAFWLFYQKGNRRYGVLSAILLGLNFYNYFYTWTFLYSFGGLLVALLLVEKKWREAVRVSSVFLGALVIAIPYIINLYRVTQHPAYEEVGARMGVVLSHAPLFVGFVVIGALGVYLFGFPKENGNRYFFGLALVTAPFVTMNQQILTGQVLQPAHYHWFFHKPVAVIIVLAVIFHLLSRWGFDSYKKILATCIITVSVFASVFTQVSSYYHDRRDGLDITLERQKYGPVMTWLSENVKKEAVVFGNNETSHMTVIYTPLNVFYHRAAPFASLSATKDRQLETMFSFYRLQGVGDKEARDVFFKDRKSVSGEIYGIYYREISGSYEAIPDEKIEEIVSQYRETLATPTDTWLYDVWQKHEVEYLVWDKKTDPTWQLEKYPFLDEVTVFGDLAIYRFNPSSKNLVID